jgi:hypothetical protein
MTLIVYNKNKISEMKTMEGCEINPRSRIVEFKCGESKYEVATVHLASGDDPKNFVERLQETEDLFKNYTVKDCSFIAGDFNEKLNKESKLLNKFKELGFVINEDMYKKLEEFTCDKMRSALQYQVNKMKKADKSTKDAILGKTPINLDS